MVKKNIRWLIIELKRAAVWLPSILIKYIIVMVLCISVAGAVAFCGKISTEENTDNEKLTIGYVAQEDMLTRLAVSYVSGMESVKSICRLKSVAYDEGIQAMKNGEMSALIVLPEDVMNEILSGSNAPATLYLPKTADIDITGLENSLNTIKTIVFEELVSAGVGMLQTAQAQIYVMSELLPDKTQLQECYDDINEFNLSLVINREKFFKKDKLSLTENNSYEVYFGAALYTACFMLTGMLIGAYCKRGNIEQLMFDKKRGISYLSQLISRIAGTFLLILIMLVLLIMMLYLPVINESIMPELTVEVLLALGVVILFGAVYFQLIYQAVKNKTYAVLWIGIMAVLQAYMSGCIIPSVLLPEMIVEVGEILPAFYIKSTFIMLFSGNTQALPDIIVGLLVWSAILFLVLWLITRRININEDGLMAGRKKIDILPGNNLFCILFRRMLFQKSFLVCVVLMVLSSAVVSRLEMTSDTTIYAAVYDEADTFREELSQYEGLIQFVFLDSEEEVKKAVLKNEAECGYVLPKQLIQGIVDKTPEVIKCYEDGDAIATEVVNEVLYNIVLGKSALEWFSGYASDRIFEQTGIKSDISEKIKRSFDSQLTEKKTFDMKVENIGEVPDANEAKAQAVYPVELVMLVGIILCGIQGLVQALSDFRRNRFYKSNRLVVALMMVIQPMLVAGLVAAMYMGFFK